MKPLKSVFGVLPALVCAVALMPLLACSGSGSDSSAGSGSSTGSDSSDGSGNADGTLMIELVKPNESCKFVDAKSGQELKYDKVIFSDATFLIALCMNEPFPMEDRSKSKGSVWLVPNSESIKTEGNKTTFEGLAMLRIADKRKYTIRDGTLTILEID